MAWVQNRRINTEGLVYPSEACCFGGSVADGFLKDVKHLNVCEAALQSACERLKNSESETDAQRLTKICAELRKNIKLQSKRARKPRSLENQEKRANMDPSQQDEDTMDPSQQDEDTMDLSQETEVIDEVDAAIMAATRASGDYVSTLMISKCTISPQNGEGSDLVDDAVRVAIHDYVSTLPTSKRASSKRKCVSGKSCVVASVKRSKIERSKIEPMYLPPLPPHQPNPRKIVEYMSVLNVSAYAGGQPTSIHPMGLGKFNTAPVALVRQVLRKMAFIAGCSVSELNRADHQRLIADHLMAMTKLPNGPDKHLNWVGGICPSSGRSDCGSEDGALQQAVIYIQNARNPYMTVLHDAISKRDGDGPMCWALCAMGLMAHARVCSSVHRSIVQGIIGSPVDEMVYTRKCSSKRMNSWISSSGSGAPTTKLSDISISNGMIINARPFSVHTKGLKYPTYAAFKWSAANGINSDMGSFINANPNKVLHPYLASAMHIGRLEVSSVMLLYMVLCASDDMSLEEELLGADTSVERSNLDDIENLCEGHLPIYVGAKLSQIPWYTPMLPAYRCLNDTKGPGSHFQEALVNGFVPKVLRTGNGNIFNRTSDMFISEFDRVSNEIEGMVDGPQPDTDHGKLASMSAGVLGLINERLTDMGIDMIRS